MASLRSIAPARYLPLIPAAAAGAACSLPLVRAEAHLWQWLFLLWIGLPITLGALFPGRAVGPAVAFNISLYAALPATVRWLDPGRDWVADQPFEFILWWLLRGVGAGIILAQAAGWPLWLRRRRV